MSAEFSDDEAMSRPISRGKRRHLIALWTPRAKAQEQRERDAATSSAWLREFNGRRWGVLPRGAEIEVLTLDSQGGSFEMFRRTVAIVNDEIAHRLGVTS